MASTTVESSKHLTTMVEKTILDLGFEQVTVKFDENVITGVGFLGEIRRLVVEGKRGKTEDKLHLIAKLLPRDLSKRDNTPLEFFCAVETAIYRDIFPKLDSIQRDAGIELKFKMPKCYAVGNERFKEFILMEDLSQQGYEMSKIGLTLDFEHSVLLLEEIARFHALCMAYRCKQSNAFEKLVNMLPVASEKTQASFKTIFDGAVNYATNNVHSEAFKIVIKDYKKFDSWEKFMFQTTSRNCKNAVFLHGDLWANNCLFKYKNSKPKEIIIIDWQGCRHTSPVIDLFFALFIAVDEKVRQERFQDLIKVYYKALCDFIKNLGENPQDLYPEKDFRDDLKTFSYAGMSYAILMVPIFASDHEEVEKKMAAVTTADENFVLGSDVPSSLYISRMEQMATDIIAHGLDELW